MQQQSDSTLKVLQNIDLVYTALVLTTVHLVLTGELVPFNSTQITVPRQRRYHRFELGPVVEDGEIVKKGDVLTNLFEKRIEHRLRIKPTIVG